MGQESGAGVGVSTPDPRLPTSRLLAPQKLVAGSEYPGFISSPKPTVIRNLSLPAAPLALSTISSELREMSGGSGGDEEAEAPAEEPAEDGSGS